MFASETQKNPKRRSGSDTHLFFLLVLLKPQSGSWGSSVFQKKKNTRVVLQSSEHQSGSSALKRSNSLLLLCFFFFLKHSVFQRCVSEESFSKRCVSEPLLSQKIKKLFCQQISKHTKKSLAQKTFCVSRKEPVCLKQATVLLVSEEPLKNSG